MIDEKLLEVKEFTGTGYKPLVFFNSWRVARLNYIDELIPENIRKVERHPQTDEVFVLTSGRGILFVGEGELEVQTLHALQMKRDVIYNVKPLTWHTVALSQDASILIIENADTSETNSQYCQLKPDMRDLIKATAQREWEHIPDK